LYRLKIKLRQFLKSHLWILIQMIRCGVIIFSLIHSVQFRDKSCPSFSIDDKYSTNYTHERKKFLSYWKIVTIANR
jgi:hypothetical protein